MAIDTPLAFFSYARDDSQFALQLAKDLKAAGVPVWLDQLDILPGQRWDQAVEDALANCPRMLVILSPSSVDSTNVMDEVSFALEERKVVIPILHRECKIPFRLRRVQYVDFRGEYNAGVRELLKVMGVEEKAQAAYAAGDAAQVRHSVPLARPEHETPETDRGLREPVAVVDKVTPIRKEPVYLKVMVWAARILALAEAGFIFSIVLRTGGRGDQEMMPFLILFSVAQMAAWKWEWQGGIVALAVCVAAALGPRDGYALFFFALPAVLFLIHWGQRRKYS